MHHLNKEDRVEHVILFLVVKHWDRALWEEWRRGHNGQVGFMIHSKSEENNVPPELACSHRVDTAWGECAYASVVLVRAALAKFPNAQSFTFASETCVPVASCAAFLSRVAEGRSVMPHFIVTEEDIRMRRLDGTSFSNAYWWIAQQWCCLSRGDAEIVARMQPEDCDMRPSKAAPGYCFPFAQDEVAIQNRVLKERLNQQDLKDLLAQRTRNNKPKYPRHKRHKRHYPAKLYSDLHAQTGIVNDMLTHFNQMRDQPHPVLYDAEEEGLQCVLQEARLKGALFFRKVRTGDDKVLPMLRGLWNARV